MNRITHHLETSSHRAAGAKGSAPRVLVAALGLALAFSVGCKSKPAAPADDASLSSALASRISGDSALASEPIQASVQDGVATLNGNVSSDAARSLAASDASQVPGIRTVVNNLTVAPPQTAALTPPPAPVKPTPAPEPMRAIKRPPPSHQQAHVDNYPPPAPIQRPEPAPVQQAPPPPPPPPPPPAFRTVTITSGSTLPVRITQTLDSATTQQGETFNGVVATDVIIDGLVAIPQGTPVSGRVSEVHEAAHFKGSSLLTVELTSITRKGEKIPITTEPFSKEGNGRGKNTAEKVGGGAAVGAILGGIFGGGKGAAIGAASGGALGAGANTITRGQQVQIPSETLVRFRLSNSIAVRASTRDAASRDNTNPDATPTGRRQLDPPQ
ncbi:BON domain-containing protein [Granulicella sp. dw_53]|uniref:BON domain-containing protein n=1 Tax=Granulicella sp. dw_53 TaxID=2719792 RepID=UPI001BD58B35|nr:BON domain-containing protein [Granulicella sp. dw_53]